ncbi:glutaminyl-peptide cyclotransferase [bacterium]|nr:glutaminyl-peptide cyclotransferase [bacterium]
MFGRDSQRRWIYSAGGVIAIVVMALATTTAFPRDQSLPVSGFRVVATYPHDPQAFSQGLAIAHGQLYEGTGQYGSSSLRKIELATGQSEQVVPLHRNYFGEGIAILNNQIFQLTWKERLCIVYDLETLAPSSSFRYTGQGWGLTTDGVDLYMSDGSATLRVLDPQTFAVRRRIDVHQGRSRIDNLNELEYVDGEILANIWYSDRIARISPKNGEVLGWIDLTALYPQAQRGNREHVLNGIAYDAEAKRLFVTGKNWPKLYEIEITPPR